MRPSLRPTLLALAPAACALALFSSPAFAAVTTSDITTPADGTTITYDSETPDTVTISGTSDGTTTDQLRIDCYFGDTTTSITNGVAVAADGSFSASIPATTFAAADLWHPCVLRAAEDGNAIPIAPPGTTSPFAGPTIRVDGTKLTRIVGAPNDGTLQDFYLQNIQPQGGFDFHSAGYCGLYDSFLWDPTTFDPAQPLFYCNDFLGFANGSSPSSPLTGEEPATGPELTVDGANAYLPGAIPEKWDDNSTADELPGFPALTYSHTFASGTHAASYTESSNAVKCAPAPATYPPTGSSCTSFAPTGVRLDRSATVTNGGLLATIHTSFSSTDGASHQLHLQLENDQNSGSNDIAYLFPWVSSAYTTESLGATVPGAPSGPGQIDVEASLAHGDDGTMPHGVIVFSRPPKDEHFITVSTDASPLSELSFFVADYDITVPATGSVALNFAYAHGFTQSQVNGLAGQAQAAITPSVSMNAPVHSTYANHVDVSGSSSAPSGVAGVSVSGTAATVAPDGSWHASVPLRAGHNSLVATVSAVDGSSAQTGAADVVYAKLGLVGRFKAKGHFVVFRLSCSAEPSSNCPGSALLVSKEKVRGKRILGVSAKKKKVKTRKVTVGRKRFKVKGGKTATIKVPLSKTGLKLLNRFHKLPVRISVSVAATGVKTKVGGAKVVFHAPKKKHKKHRG